MIHVSLPRPTGNSRAYRALSLLAASALRPGPVMPWDYLRLRREAAGLSIAQVGRRLFPTDQAKADLACSLMRSLETPGVRARIDMTLDRLVLAFPFDADVYRQLAHDPVEQHPRVCIGCGCSQNDACVSADGHDCCGWHAASRPAADVCTRCSGDVL